MRALKDYVGIRFRDKGTDPETGLDCWNLVRLFYREELGKEVPDYMAFYRSALDIEGASAAICRAIPDWVAVDPPLYGDVLVFRITHAPWHTAIALDGGLMLHTDEGTGSVIEQVRSLRWRDRLYGAYRWKY